MQSCSETPGVASSSWSRRLSKCGSTCPQNLAEISALPRTIMSRAAVIASNSTSTADNIAIRAEHGDAFIDAAPPRPPCVPLDFNANDGVDQMTSLLGSGNGYDFGSGTLAAATTLAALPNLTALKGMPMPSSLPQAAPVGAGGWGGSSGALGRPLGGVLGQGGPTGAGGQMVQNGPTPGLGGAGGGVRGDGGAPGEGRAPGSGMLAETATCEQKDMTVQQIVMKMVSISSSPNEVRKLLHSPLSQERLACRPASYPVPPWHAARASYPVPPWHAARVSYPVPSLSVCLCSLASAALSVR